MTKRLITACACLFFMATLPAGVMWKEAATGGGGQSFLDDFTSLSNWLNFGSVNWTVSGGLAIAGGTAFEEHWMVYLTDTDTDDQWCLIHYENVVTTLESSLSDARVNGCIFRVLDNGGTYDFITTYWDNDHDLAGMSAFDNSVGAWAVTDSACFAAAGGDIDDPDWLGVTLTNSGASTVVNLWVSATDLGTDPSTWGTADCSLTAGSQAMYPGGLGIGMIGAGRATHVTGAQVRVSEWEGGDQ